MPESIRHMPVGPHGWDAAQAAAAIEEIVTDALANFAGTRFWPAHPQDEGLRDGTTSFYFGATGVIWALDYLWRIGATATAFDFAPVLTHLLYANEAEFARTEYAAHGSLLFGDLGTALTVFRLRPGPAIADTIYERAAANTHLPIRELMWGMPGSMLACIHMHDMTGERRWELLFGVQAARLLAELEETDFGTLWTQDLYGRHLRYLGPVHGLAGNLIPLLRGWHWLEEGQRARITDFVPHTLERTAWRSPTGINWPAIAASGNEPPHLCQHCHGAPGIVTTFADAPIVSTPLNELLLQGGEFAWTAGPLRKGSNLCHGTGGNGYAFLKLYRLTKDAIWLDRARAFAMTAIAQCREARVELGRGRYSLWTGDVGLAIYLWDCLTAKPHFPTIDVF